MQRETLVLIHEQNQKISTSRIAEMWWKIKPIQHQAPLKNFD